MALTQTAETRYTKPVLVAVNKPFDDEGGLKALRSHPMFSELSGKDLQHLIQQSRRLRLGHHQLLYRQDMPAHHFFFVISGCACTAWTPRESTVPSTASPPATASPKS